MLGGGVTARLHQPIQTNVPRSRDIAPLVDILRGCLPWAAYSGGLSRGDGWMRRDTAENSCGFRWRRRRCFGGWIAGRYDGVKVELGTLAKMARSSSPARAPLGESRSASRSTCPCSREFNAELEWKRMGRSCELSRSEGGTNARGLRF